MKGIFFERFAIAVHAEPWELKNTLMHQLWHVGRLRFNNSVISSGIENTILSTAENFGLTLPSPFEPDLAQWARGPLDCSGAWELKIPYYKNEQLILKVSKISNNFRL